MTQQLMTQCALIQQHDELLNRLRDLTQRKNADYAGVNDPFHNFLLVEHLKIATAEEGILVRIGDKFGRLTNLLAREAQVKDESFEDTALDLANYALLLILVRRSKNKAANS